MEDAAPALLSLAARRNASEHNNLYHELLGAGFAVETLQYWGDRIFSDKPFDGTAYGAAVDIVESREADARACFTTYSGLRALGFSDIASRHHTRILDSSRVPCSCIEFALEFMYHHFDTKTQDVN
jgi:hypothetical protein